MYNSYRQRPNVEKHMSYLLVKNGVVHAGKAIDYSFGNPTIVAKENSRIII